MVKTLDHILGPDGAIARRLGNGYEHRPQQLEMADAVASAFAKGENLLVEAGTGVGKSFAYLLPAIDHAVRNKKRVVISTHTISLQEQLIEKDIPLLQSVYPDEFTAVLVKGRGNYLCQRRLALARSRQNFLFESSSQMDSLMAIEDWAQRSMQAGGNGSLAELPAVPDPGVWDKVNAEAGNCLGKKCDFYKSCFWQAAKRRMSTGNVLIVNHALFFSDLALRMAGVNYLPKYDVAVLDEAHTIEDVAGQHFGLKITEAGIRYGLRALYDPRRGGGMLSSHGAGSNDCIRDIVDLGARIDDFFERCINWHQEHGRGNGRLREPLPIADHLTPKLRELVAHLKEMVPSAKTDEDLSELTAAVTKIANYAEVIPAITQQTMPDAVYWMEVSPRSPRRVSLHAAPVNIADALRQYLFEKTRSVVMTSATLCTGAQEKKTAPRSAANSQRGMSVPLMVGGEASESPDVQIRQGANLPHWTSTNGVYSVTFRLADSLPKVALAGLLAEKQKLQQSFDASPNANSEIRKRQLAKARFEIVDRYLDQGHGECLLSDKRASSLLSEALAFFDSERYRLIAWCIMPNHVHIVLQPIAGYTLPTILHSIKSWSAKQINKAMERTGEVWQHESYDHLVRDPSDLRNQVEYTFSNAERAGWKDWPWRGTDEEVFSELVDGIYVKPERKHEQDAHATDQRFAYIKNRLGVTNEKTLALGSPFDYANQVTLYLETQLPEPNDPRFMPAAGEAILKYLQQTNGGAFVLFTSYKMLIDAANRLQPAIEQLGYTLLVQGQRAPRKVLLDRFRATPNAVLFGTGSFWQGIDVQGDALRNVIIVKLPFAVPDEPIIEARLEDVQRSGGNPFMEYSVPEAIIKLKQGFGRLIRSRTDRGIVVILDSRVKTKRYGRLFLASLPACKIVEV